jgi:uncharacterized protein (TIGR02646 family)
MKWEGFSGGACYWAVRASLSAEQHGLCCYCETQLGEHDCHVEHMEPRHESCRRWFDYFNLAVSCNGGAVEHCGHYKDNAHRNRNYKYDPALFRTPHDPSTASLFRYLQDGTVWPSAADVATSASYLIGYLGLDSARLNVRRRNHARTVVRALGDVPTAERLAWARDYFVRPDQNGVFQSYVSLSASLIDSLSASVLES